MIANSLSGAFALTAAVAIALFACEAKSTNCFPSDYRPCSCSDGRSGLQACSTVGDGYGACDCTGAIPVPAQPDAGADGGPDAAALVGFGKACAVDSDCPSGACFAGGMRAFCTLRCGTNADCPNPPTSGTCNMRGFCK